MMRFKECLFTSLVMFDYQYVKIDNCVQIIREQIRFVRCDSMSKSVLTFENSLFVSTYWQVYCRSCCIDLCTCDCSV